MVVTLEEALAFSVAIALLLAGHAYRSEFLLALSIVASVFGLRPKRELY
jgi:hypothetical protein